MSTLSGSPFNETNKIKIYLHKAVNLLLVIISAQLNVISIFLGKTNLFSHRLLYTPILFTMIAKNFILLLIMVNSAFSQIPDYIKICRRSDPNINECIVNSIEHLESYLKVGIPEIDVPSLEPLRLNGTISLNLGGGDTTILTNITELAAHGASSFKINQLWSTIEKNSFRYNVTIPTILLDGIYEIDTRLLFLHIKGKGKIIINIDKYNFECVMSGQKVTIDGTEHLKFDELKCDIQFDKATVNLDNLFNGNKLLQNAINDVINDNVNIFFKEVKPKIEQAINDVFLDVANKITLRFSYSELFPE